MPNACTGAQGYENVVTEAKEVAKLLDIKPEEVVVGSTGVIGQQLPMDVIKEGIKKLVPELKSRQTKVKKMHPGLSLQQIQSQKKRQ